MKNAAGIHIVKNEIKERLDKMVDRANNAGAFARVYPLYQKLQTERFRTENASEGKSWPALQSEYKQYKKKRYGGGPKRGGGNWRTYPGSGTKMLIGTSTLAGAVIGPGAPFVSQGIQLHRAKFSKYGMEISLDLSGTNAEGKPFTYARDVARQRPFMEFSKKSKDKMKAEVLKYIIGGG